MKRHLPAVSAVAFSVGAIAILALASGEILGDAPAEPPVVTASATPAAPPRSAEVAPTSVEQPAVVAVEAAAPAREPAVTQQALDASIAPAFHGASHTPSKHGDGALPELGSLPTLADRLRAVDDLKERSKPEEAVTVLTALLDSDLGSSFYEAETLRIYIIGRLSELPGPRADAALIARIDPNRPRPQRLIAVEALAARPAAGRNELEIIARNDHDTVVQERARWALAHAR